jgi:hypothetical protein
MNGYLKLVEYILSDLLSLVPILVLSLLPFGLGWWAGRPKLMSEMARKPPIVTVIKREKGTIPARLGLPRVGRCADSSFMPSRILRENALSVLQTMPSARVHCIVTSPPYWGPARLRNREVEGRRRQMRPQPGAPRALGRETRKLGRNLA